MLRNLARWAFMAALIFAINWLAFRPPHCWFELKKYSTCVREHFETSLTGNSGANGE